MIGASIGYITRVQFLTIYVINFHIKVKKKYRKVSLVGCNASKLLFILVPG